MFRNIILIGMAVGAASMAGWFSINREGDQTTIQINKAEIAEDARRAIDRGRNYFDEREQRLASQQNGQSDQWNDDYRQADYSERSYDDRQNQFPQPQYQSEGRQEERNRANQYQADQYRPVSNEPYYQNQYGQGQYREADSRASSRADSQGAQGYRGQYQR